MKIKISVGDIPYPGYTNIDPSPQLGENTINIDIRIGNPGSLELIEDSSCTDIVVHNYIEKLNLTNYQQFISNWCRKLRHRGSIKVIGTDVDTVARKYANGEISPGDLNKILFGEHKHVWDSNHICLSISVVCAILADSGLKIKDKEIIGDKYVISAYRP